MADSEEVKGVVMVEGSEEEEAGKVGSLEAAKEEALGADSVADSAVDSVADSEEDLEAVVMEAAMEEVSAAVAKEVGASNIVRAHLPMMK